MVISIFYVILAELSLVITFMFIEGLYRKRISPYLILLTMILTQILEIDATVQIIIAVIMCGVVWVVNKYSDVFGDYVTLLSGADKAIGLEVVILDDVKEGEWGRVEIDNNIYSVATPDRSPLFKGERVKIIRIEGVKYIVEKKL